MTDVTQAGPENGLHGDTHPDGQEKAQDVAGQAQEKAQEVAGQAQEKAQEVAGQAKGRAQQLVDERSTQVGEQVSGHASDLRSVGETLRERGNEGPAKLVEQAAQRAERAGSYLTESDADRILGDIEDLARRNPWAVVLGGLALGFAASRFLKASSQQRFEERGTGTGPSYSSDRGYVPAPPTGAPAAPAVSAPNVGSL